MEKQSDLEEETARYLVTARFETDELKDKEANRISRDHSLCNTISL